MKIPMAEIMHENWWKKGWWRNGKEDGRSQKGRHMYVFFLNVSSRLRTWWFVATHYITQMVSGHGTFKERLHRLGLAKVSRCSCALGGSETPEHILYECTKYNSIRYRLQERALIEGVAWPPQLDFWVRRGCYKDFAAYVGRTMRLRLEEEPLHREL